MLEIPMRSHNKFLILGRLEVLVERSLELILPEGDSSTHCCVVFFSRSTDLPLDLVDGEAKNILNSPVELCSSSCVHESPT